MATITRLKPLQPHSGNQLLSYYRHTDVLPLRPVLFSPLCIWWCIKTVSSSSRWTPKEGDEALSLSSWASAACLYPKEVMISLCAVCSWMWELTYCTTAPHLLSPPLLLSLQNPSDRCRGDRCPLHGCNLGSKCSRVSAPQEHQEEESASPLPGDRGEQLGSCQRWPKSYFNVGKISWFFICDSTPSLIFHTYTDPSHSSIPLFTKKTIFIGERSQKCTRSVNLPPRDCEWMTRTGH